MGRELQCRARTGGKWIEGKAMLETTELSFRGSVRFKVPFAELTAVSTREGELHLKWSTQSAVLELGAQAEKWAHSILHPKSTVGKLGVKPGFIISALNLPDDSTVHAAQDSAAAFSDKKPLKNSDMLLYGAATPSDLGDLKKLLPSIAANGALWIVYPKGRKEITEMQVLTAGRAAGLVDVKVVSYSATHTALKFVRPKDKR